MLIALVKYTSSAIKNIVKSGLVGVLVSGFLLPTQAHEFWLAPTATPLFPGGSASLSLLVGEVFTGELVGFSKAQTAGLRQYTADGVKDLQVLVPAQPVAALQLPLARPGTHLIAYESQPNFISLSADKFHAYLHDEGLDFIKARREAEGTAERPGRERYRRFVKTLLDVREPLSASGALAARTSAADVTFSARVGQQLELVPLSDPLRLPVGDALSVQVLFEGRPLAGALLKAWHKRSGQLLIVRATTGSDGIASVNLPYAGPWMTSVVHMVPATGVKDTDWDSLWGNLSFVLPGK